MTKKTVEVRIEVDVTIDESKFTPEFMEEFEAAFYPFTSIDEHIEYLGRLAALEVFTHRTEFIEGYGPPKDMGLKAKVVSTDAEILWGASE